MSFQLTILGAGSATPSLLHNPSAQLLMVEHEGYLIDCGEGTQFQLLKYKIRPSKLKYIFISHLHGDHYLGLMGLISSLNLGRRTEDLHVFGPKGLAEIITIQLQYSNSWLFFKLHFHENDTTIVKTILENDYVSVETIPLSHRTNCCGFLFREKKCKRNIIKELLPPNLSIENLKKLKDGLDIIDEAGNILYKNEGLTKVSLHQKSYAYCSDTIYKPDLVPQLQQIDLLYHEATYLHDLHQQAADRYHSTAKQAAQIAYNAQVGKLLIGHFSSRYKDVTPLLEEAKLIFPNTELALEGESFGV